MANKFKLLILIALGLFVSADAGADNTQSDTRENPLVEAGNTIPTVSYPSYIALNENHIDMNGADWSVLAEVFAAADSCPVTIVHIGDSHQQADMGTAVTRTRLGNKFDHLRGRGLMVPFKLAGTNEPVDYKITSCNSFTQSRLLKLPWPTRMGFSGIAIQPECGDFTLKVETKETFDALTIYYTGDTLELMSAIGNGEPVLYDASGIYKALKISFPDSYTDMELSLKAPECIAIHGVNASLGDTGLAYHVIGNNGATFATYSMIGGVGEDVSEMFEPDLIILSMGTNEAFNNVTDGDFRRSINVLVQEMRMSNPEAQLLLVTPQECHRKVKRGRGRRRHTAFQVNSNVKRMRDIIVAYGRDNGIPVYDWYKVAGGTGSSHSWIADKHMNTDHIHLTLSGYQIHGNLMTDALLEQLCPSL